MKYSNTDCFNEELTYNSKATYDIKLTESNCLTFVGNTSNYIYFGDSDDFADIVKVKLSWLTQATSWTPDACLFTGLLGCVDTTSHNRCVFNYSIGNKKFVFGFGPNLYDFSFTCTLNTQYNIELEFKNTGNAPTLIVNGEVIANTATRTWSVTQTTDHHMIGLHTQTTTTSTTSVQNACRGSLWNIRLYDINDNLVHHYPLSEGYGNVIYDTVGDTHGYLASPNLETNWMQTRQNDYHYNLENGFYRIEADKDKIVGVGKQNDTSTSIHGNLINRYQKYIRIPKHNLLDGNKILIMKSCFEDKTNTTTYHKPTNLNTTDISSITVTKIEDESDGKTYVNVNIPSHSSTTASERYATCGINLLPGFNTVGAQAYNILYPQPANEYVAKMKFRLNSYKLAGEESLPYYLSIGLFSLGNNETIQMMAGGRIAKGEWLELTLKSASAANVKKSTHNLSVRTPWLGLRGCIEHSTLGTTTVVPNGTTDISADYDIKDVRIYKVGSYNYYEPVENGYNQSENKIVIDENNNIAELNNVIASYLPDDWNLICDARSFGQNYYYKWNITETVTSAITNYIVRAGTRVTYLKCIDTGLPSEIQSTWAYPRGISFTTDMVIPNTNAMNFVAIGFPQIKQYQGKIQNNTIDYNLLEFKARVHFYYRKNSEDTQQLVVAGCYQNASQYDRGRDILAIYSGTVGNYEVGKWYEFDEVVDLMYAGANSAYQYIGFSGDLKSGSTFAEGAWSICDLWIEIIGAPQNIDAELIQDDKGRIKGMKNILIHNQNPSSTLAHKRLQLKTKF